MSAADVIAMIEKLPPTEKAEVFAFVRGAGAGETAGERKIRYIPDEKFDEIVPKIFDRHEELFRRLSQ